MFKTLGWSEAASAYTVALEIVPLFFWMWPDPPSRLQALYRSSSLASDAATWALLFQSPHNAIEILEEGRAVFWTQALYLKGSFDSLPSDFGGRLKSIAQCLRAPSLAEPSPSSTESLRRRKLQGDWAKILGELREVPGFEYFLSRKPFFELSKAAAWGIIVVLIASTHGCNAIIMRPKDPSPLRVALEMNLRQATRLRDWWMGILSASQIQRQRGPSLLARRESPQRLIDNEMHRVLVGIWDDIVKPVLDNLNLTVHTLSLFRSALCSYSSGFRESTSPMVVSNRSIRIPTSTCRMQFGRPKHDHPVCSLVIYTYNQYPCNISVV